MLAVRKSSAAVALALAATVVASLNIVGVTLLAAAIVIPPATARLVTDSFGRLLVLSTLLGALYGLVGMFVSYATDVSSGAAIVLLATCGFAVAWVCSGLRRTVIRQPAARTAPRPTPAPALVAERDGHLFD